MTSSYQLIEETKTKNGGGKGKNGAETLDDQAFLNTLLEVRRCLTRSKYCGMIMGWIVGCFLESAVLGIFFILNEKEMLSGGLGFYRDNDLVTGIVLGWSFITALMAVTVSFLMRNLIWAVFASATTDADEKTHKYLEQVMQKIIRNVDIWYGLGSIIGMSVSWIAAYAVLGWRHLILQNLWVIVMALSCWLLVCSSYSNNATTENDIAELTAENKSKKFTSSQQIVATGVPLTEN